MPRFKLTIEYDGSRYRGWQFQREAATVMGKLMDAIKEVYKVSSYELYGAGRTDAGVHALGQVAHLDIDSAMPPYVAMERMNEVLPASINILDMAKVSPRFHARYDAKHRSYVYHISRRRTAFGKDYCWWVKEPLNVEAMAAVTHHFTGMKDYKSFGAPEKEGESTLVKIDHLKIFEVDDSILIHIVGSHFLWKQVRRMVGTLVQVGLGKLSEADIDLFFSEYSTLPAKFTAPPSGLYLEHVYYAGESINQEPTWLINIGKY
ncbi:tRNA pseudouridine(38-40) synthase TruA [Tenuifilum osseticum]|uniref:tRNA pseudouridine(38-40) synthase TruA n=1 Tax=Tenuifilum osseticum TaxID=3374723 RepID=UPI0034E43382